MRYPRGWLYDQFYYDGGAQGISNYREYVWDAEKCAVWTDHALGLGLGLGDRVVDFGCAKGFMVRGLRARGIEAFGCDISEYAIGRAIEPTCCHWIDRHFLAPFRAGSINAVLSFHTLEHPAEEELIDFFRDCLAHRIEKIVVVVPLGENGRYLNPKHENDRTHVQRLSADGWCRWFTRHGYCTTERAVVNHDLLFARFNRIFG